VRALNITSKYYNIYFKIRATTLSFYEPVSSVSIVSDCGLDDRAIEVSIPGRDERILPLASMFRPALRPTQPPVSGYGGGGGPFPGTKARPWRDADHSPPSSAEIENE
jgi:hypothetical protein